jgi:hypothetical protein
MNVGRVEATTPQVSRPRFIVRLDRNLDRLAGAIRSAAGLIRHSEVQFSEFILALGRLDAMDSSS